MRGRWTRLAVLRIAAVALSLVFMASLSEAVPVGFGCITPGASTVNCATGAAQLTVDVTDGPNANDVVFTFNNLGPNASSITDIYFDDGTLLAIANITNGSGVDFAQGASPGNLPDGNTISPAFQTSAGFSADSNPPTQPNGVNPGEFVSILFTLQSGQEFQTVLDSLTSGDLRIGLHVQAFADGASVAFVNNDCVGPDCFSTVPVPSTVMLLGAGLAGLGGLSVYRRRR